MKKYVFLLVLGMLATTLSVGCQSTGKPLHIGSKEFTEQLVLGEMLAQLAENNNIPVKRSLPYGNTFLCSEALKKGDLDLYVEYNGTALTLLGQPPISDGDEAFKRVKTLFKPLGLIWAERLGFANNFELLMRSDRAAALKIETISDLAKLPSQIRFVSPEEWIERPLDGLSALTRRYGLVATAQMANSKSKLYHELISGNADVAVGYSTDGHIEDYGLTVLRDDLRFFPVYEAAPLVHLDAMRRYPALPGILAELANAIDTNTMRSMNRAVELEGETVAAVANRFLIETGLLPEDAKIPSATPKDLLLAIGLHDDLSGAGGKALRASRSAFPKRRVKIVRHSTPKALLTANQARIALLGAEAFYTVAGDGLPIQDTTVEALGVIGHRMAHVLAVTDSPVHDIGQMKKIGAGPQGGASYRSAEIVVDGLAMGDAVDIIAGTLQEQVSMVQKGQLDGIFLMVAPGARQVAELMRSGNFKLVSIDGWQEGNALMRFPFFRLSRIAAGSYPGQSTAIETISAQTVLAGPSPKEDLGTGNAGPVAVATSGQAISDAIILKLNSSVGVEEKIDPAIPSAKILRPQKEVVEKKLQTDYFLSGANALVLIAVVYLLYLFFAEEKRRKRRSKA